MPEQRLIIATVCGGKQARVCLVTRKDGGSVACKDCGVTAMEIHRAAGCRSREKTQGKPSESQLEALLGVST